MWADCAWLIFEVSRDLHPGHRRKIKAGRDLPLGQLKFSNSFLLCPWCMITCPSPPHNFPSLAIIPRFGIDFYYAAWGYSARVSPSTLPLKLTYPGIASLSHVIMHHGHRRKLLLNFNWPKGKSRPAFICPLQSVSVLFETEMRLTLGIPLCRIPLQRWICRQGQNRQTCSRIHFANLSIRK